MEDKEKRKKQISFMVRLYFDKVNYLKDKDIDEWTKKALDAFLDSDLSIDEINEQMAKTFKNKDEVFKMNNKDEEEYMRFMFVEDEEAYKDEELEKPKQLVKTNDNGFANNVILTTLSLITFTLCGIGLVILYLVG